MMRSGERKRFPSEKLYRLFLVGIFFLHLSLVDLFLSRLAPYFPRVGDNSEHAMWTIAPSFEDSRALLHRVADFSSINDFSTQFWIQSTNEVQYAGPSVAVWLQRVKMGWGTLNIYERVRDLPPLNPVVAARNRNTWGDGSTFGTGADHPRQLFRGSVIRFAGSRKGLSLEYPDALPKWANTRLLNPTRLQLLMDSNITVLSASIVPPGSVALTADQTALNIVRRIRFQAGHISAHSPLTWGILDFIWKTEAPSVNPQEVGAETAP